MTSPRRMNEDLGSGHRGRGGGCGARQLPATPLDLKGEAGFNRQMGEIGRVQIDRVSHGGSARWCGFCHITQRKREPGTWMMLRFLKDHVGCRKL